MRFLTLISIIALFSACSSEDEPTESVLLTPQWSEGFPQVAFGATSVDLNLRTESSAEVYYVISDGPLQFTAEELVYSAQYPDTSAIKSAGRIELNGNTDLRKTITFLEEGRTHFGYFILRGRSGNVLSGIKTADFKTYYRQDTATFQSAAENRVVNYLIYRPEELLKYPEVEFPVCFSFGDKKSAGSDLKPINIVRDGSIAEYIYHLHNVPLIVVSMQSLTSDWNLSLIDEGVNHVISTYPVDEKRIYLTGYGEGAMASWNYAIANPHKITAIVPVSGKGNLPEACNLVNVDVWAFHNVTDDIIASSNTKKMLNAIDKCAPEKELTAIYFPDAGHNAWKRVYNAAHSDWSKSPGIDKFNIYTWMLSKSKP